MRTALSKAAYLWRICEEAGNESGAQHLAPVDVEVVVRPPSHVGLARRKGACANWRQEKERLFGIILVRNRDDLDPVDCALN